MRDTAAAAAILACEASRQQLAFMKTSEPRDVPGELLQLYHWYVGQLSAPHDGDEKAPLAPSTPAMPSTPVAASPKKAPLWRGR